MKLYERPVFYKGVTPPVLYAPSGRAWIWAGMVSTLEDPGGCHWAMIEALDFEFAKTASPEPFTWPTWWDYATEEARWNTRRDRPGCLLAHDGDSWMRAAMVNLWSFNARRYERIWKTVADATAQGACGTLCLPFEG